MKGALQLGKISGIKVSIHWTFLFLLAWIIFINVRAGADAIGIVWSIGFTLAIFVCVVLHEFGHALTAQKFHIETRDITLYPIGGVARLDSIPKKPKEELLVAIAGPAVNFIIAGVLLPFADFSSIKEGLSLTEINPANFITAFAGVNLSLGVFNLIPAFPMDGGRVFRALLTFKMSRMRATRIAAYLGQAIAIGFMFIGFYVNPIMIFIGLFIFMGAQAESNYARTEALLDGQSIGSITMHEVALLQMNETIGDIVSQLLDSQKKSFIVYDGDNLVGTLGQNDIINGLREHSEGTPVSDIMDKDILYLPISLPIEKALVEMQRKNKSMAVVMDGSEQAGILDTENLLEYIMIQGARQDYLEHAITNR